MRSYLFESAVILFAVFGFSPAWAQQTGAEFQVNATPTDITCAAAREYMAHLTGKEDPTDVDLYSLRDRQCLNKIYNDSNDDKPIVTIATYDPGEKRVLFNTIRTKDARSVAVGCKIVVAIASGNAFSDDPLTASIAGAAGKYSCDSYLQAAIKSDPLLIVMPTLIPTIALTKDAWREFRKGAQKVTTAGGVVPGTTIPLVLVAPNIAVAMAAGQVTAEVAGNVTRETGQAIHNTAREAGRAATNVRRCVTKPWKC